MTESTTARGRDLPMSVAELLDLESLSDTVYLAASSSRTEHRGLYGGRVAALALRAALHTVAEDRAVHSLHGYFLRPGDPRQPIVLRVEPDRDGGRFSTRRVLACQGAATIFHLSCSFQVPQAGPDYQHNGIPEAEDPDTLESFQLDHRMLDLDARVPTDRERWHRWPARLWIRAKEPLPDVPNIHACALVFLSDMCTGLSKAPDVEQVGLMPSLDHAVWLHRPPRVNDWVLMDLVPESTSGGRGMYFGRIFGRDGSLVASLAQEALFRPPPPPGSPPIQRDDA